MQICCVHVVVTTDKWSCYGSWFCCTGGPDSCIRIYDEVLGDCIWFSVRRHEAYCSCTMRIIVLCIQSLLLLSPFCVAGTHCYFDVLTHDMCCLKGNEHDVPIGMTWAMCRADTSVSVGVSLQEISGVE